MRSPDNNFTTRSPTCEIERLMSGNPIRPAQVFLLEAARRSWIMVQDVSTAFRECGGWTLAVPQLFWGEEAADETLACLVPPLPSVVPKFLFTQDRRGRC